MMMLNKAQQLNMSIRTAVQQGVESFIADVATQLKSPVYNRSVNLPPLIQMQFPFEADEPNLVSPSEEDVKQTVHILAKIEAQLTFEDVKLRSGLYERDYGRLMHLYHALSKENEFLNRQLSIIHQREQMTIAQVEKSAETESVPTKKVKAA